MNSNQPMGAQRTTASRRLLGALTLTVVALATGAFTLSFDALRALAVTAGVNAHITWLWPLIVDGFIVIATAAAVLLRERGWSIAWYPWATLILFAGVSVAGNAHHAANHADRTAVSVTIAALVSAVPAIALLLSSHLLVVLLTPGAATAGRPKPTHSPATSRSENVHAHQPREISSQRERAAPPAHPPNAKQPVSGSRPARPAPSDRDLQEWITMRLARGEPVTGNSVAQHLGCSPATGRRRLAQLRHQPRGCPPTPSATVNAGVTTP